MRVLCLAGALIENHIMAYQASRKILKRHSNRENTELSQGVTMAVIDPDNGVQHVVILGSLRI
jgi:hypothetical protein